jgi:PIN domain nuclease of toxin-antitoxin system
VNLLLDTHVLLWSYFGDPRLNATATAAITDPANPVFVSIASLWEIAIKVSTGKLLLRQPFPAFLQSAVFSQWMTVVAVEPRHLAALSTLPYPTNHRDPFDRLIVAQALTDGFTLVSADAKLDAYGVTRIW